MKALASQLIAVLALSSAFLPSPSLAYNPGGDEDVLTPAAYDSVQKYLTKICKEEKLCGNTRKYSDAEVALLRCSSYNTLFGPDISCQVSVAATAKDEIHGSKITGMEIARARDFWSVQTLKSKIHEAESDPKALITAEVEEEFRMLVRHVKWDLND